MSHFGPSSGCAASGGGGTFDGSSITGAPAAGVLALADVFPVAQSGTLAKATIQQALDASGLLVADASPADSDVLLVNQGGVAKSLAVSAARTQLDKGVAGGRTINGGTALADILSLAGGAASIGFQVKSRTGVVDWLVATDDGTFGVPTLTAAGATNPWPIYIKSRGNREISFLTNNTQRWNIRADGGIEDAKGSGATITIASPSSTAPTYAFVGSTTTGLGLAAAGAPCLIAAGVEVLRGLSAPSGATGPALFVPNLSAEPTSNPTGGGFLYCFAGALKYRGSGGTTTTVGAT